MNVVGHDAEPEDRMIGVKPEDFITGDFGKVGSFQPTAAFGRAHRERDDVVLAVEDLIRKVVPFSALHT